MSGVVIPNLAQTTDDNENGPDTEINDVMDDDIYDDAPTIGYVLKQLCRECFSIKTLKRKLPILKWLPKYRFIDLQCDFIAGLTVGLILVPQALAYTKIAQLPLQYGLYSSFIGCFLYVIFGTSKDMSVGPTAVLALLTASFTRGHAWIAVILTLLSGSVMFVMGLFNLGFMVNFISYPVISGYTTAAAITIGMSQLPGLIGLNTCAQSTFPGCFMTIVTNFTSVSVWDIVLGLGCITSICSLKQFTAIALYLRNKHGKDASMRLRFIQRACKFVAQSANFIVVSLATTISYLLETGSFPHRIDITGELAQGLPEIEAPAFSVFNLTSNTTLFNAEDVFVSLGAGIAIVPLLSLTEALAISRSLAKKNHYRVDASQEMLALGIINICSSFVSSYPVTGSMTRTAVNSESGVRTTAGGVFSGLLVILVMEFLTGVFQYIPTAALSAVVIVAVASLLDLRLGLKLWRTQKMELLSWLATVIFSLILGIQIGILLGIAVAIITLLYPAARPDISVYFDRNVPRVQLSHGLMFPAVDRWQDHVLDVVRAASEPCGIIILDWSHVYSIDYSTIQGVTDLIDELQYMEVKAYFVGLKPSILREMKRARIDGFIYADTHEDVYMPIHGDNKDE